MIWLLLAIQILGFGYLIREAYYVRRYLLKLVSLLPSSDCRFKESESKCLYSPGSEPERICVLREEDKKNKDSKTQVIPAPRWIDRSPPESSA